jgi:hypothetical protein
MLTVAHHLSTTRSRSNRARRVLAVTASVAALPILLAACGANSDTVTPAAPATTASPSTTTAAGLTTNLRIVVNDGTGKTTTWTLSCDPADGTHPDPSAACAVLTAKGKTALPPVAKGLMCSQIYGGPQTATITGVWSGKAVNSQFSRRNGCEISRWKALQGLLPTVAAGLAQ